MPKAIRSRSDAINAKVNLKFMWRLTISAKVHTPTTPHREWMKQADQRRSPTRHKRWHGQHIVGSRCRFANIFL